MQRSLILGLFFALLIAIFSIQNAGPVSLVFFTWRFETSLVVVVLGGIALGALMMGLFDSLKQFKLSREIKNLRVEKDSLLTKNAELEEKITMLEDVGEKEEDNFTEMKDERIDFN